MLLQTVRRIFCIAILNLWAGVDNIIAGVIDYFSDAGVGVLAVFALSFLHAQLQRLFKNHRLGSLT